MNGKEVIAKIREILEKHEVSVSELAREECPQEAWDEMEQELGTFKLAHHGRPAYGHDEMLVVYELPKHGVHVAMSGYYDSWSGTDWSCAELEEVRPVERKYTAYETVK